MNDEAKNSLDKLLDKIDEASRDEEMDRILCEKYPSIFRERNLSTRESCMGRGICVQSGWGHILDNLCIDLDYMSDALLVNVIFEQVKEKFGVLRIYYSVEERDMPKEKVGWQTPRGRIIKRMVDSAMGESTHVCETCGDYAEFRGKLSWKRTLCTEHYIARLCQCFNPQKAVEVLHEEDLWEQYSELAQSHINKAEKERAKMKISMEKRKIEREANDD